MAAKKSYCILYNPLSSTGSGEEKARKLIHILGEDAEVVFRSLIDIEDKREFLLKLDPATIPIITGGDGTLSRFVNSLNGNPTRDIYLRKDE